MWLQQLILMMTDELRDWWLQARKRVPKSRRKAFDLFVFLVVWLLWLERNTRVFSSTATTTLALVHSFSDQCNLWCQAGLVVRSHLLGM
jgi:hypothetical protein